MDSIVVMITGIGGGGHGEQILKALKMANTPYKFIGGDMNKYSQGLCNVDYPYILPPATSPNYMDAILNICRKHNVQALFHGSEPELRVFSENRQAIQKEGIFLPINPVEVIDLCMNKYRTFQWLKEHGFSVPETKIINEINQLDEINVFPVVLKPFIGGGGSNNIFIAQNRSEIIMIGSYLFNAIGPFIVQEYIGTVDNEFTVGILVDMDGNFINSVAVNRTILSGLSNRIKMRNKTGLDKFGEYLVISSGISQGKIGAYPEVTATCEEIAVQLGCRGSINIQCRFYDKKVYVFEINPRFSGTTSLRAMIGYNEPDILIRKHILKEEIFPRFPYKNGYIVRGLSETLIDVEGIPYAY